MNDATLLLTRSHNLSERRSRGSSRNKFDFLRPPYLHDAKSQKPSDVFSTKGAQYDSPGQRPGFVSAQDLRALKGRHIRCFAPSGLGMFLAVEPRTLSWAISLRPVGAETLPADFAESLSVEQAINANLRGLGYGG